MEKYKFRVYYKDENGVRRVRLVNDVSEIEKSCEIIKVESTRPAGVFKCC